MSDDGWPQIVAHRERLLRIARRRCPTREDAEDVVSEAMLRCATFEGLDEARLGQFLTTVTMRLCADLYRSADRGSRAVARLGADPETVPGPEDEACRAADAAMLAGLLATLPDRQRAVLVDRASGLSLSQIALRNALTYKAAESALARARGTLRGALAAAMGVLGAAWVTLRPRRVAAVAALPAVTFLALTAVLRLPAPAPRMPFALDAPEGRSGATVAALAPHRLTTAPAPRPARPHRVRAARPVAAAVAPPAPPHDRIVVVDPGQNPGGVGLIIDDGNPKRDFVQYAQYCVQHGVYVVLNPNTQGEREFEQGCGHS